MKNIVILVSGGGSNMAAIAAAARVENWQQRFGARIAAVLSNRADAGGLTLARRLGIATAVVEHRAYATRAAFEAELLRVINLYDPQGRPALVVLAGFMRILSGEFVQSYAGRIVNIHPSLLPAFPGLHTHRRTLVAGCKLAGATVHLVTGELDAGPILAQAAVPVLAGDTEASLAQRVLTQEHLIYPRAIADLLQSPTGS